MAKERDGNDVRTESIGAAGQATGGQQAGQPTGGQQAEQPTQLMLLQQFMQALAAAAAGQQTAQADEPTPEEKATAYAKKHVASAPSGSSYWCVDIRHLDKKEEAPYMNVPRIFYCSEHQAPELYKRLYGIRHTEHQIVAWPATEKHFAAQTKRDVASFAGGHHRRDKIMEELPAMPEMTGAGVA